MEYVSREDMKNAIRSLDDTRLGGKYIRVREVRGIRHVSLMGGGG